VWGGKTKNEKTSENKKRLGYAKNANRQYIELLTPCIRHRKAKTDERQEKNEKKKHQTAIRHLVRTFEENAKRQTKGWGGDLRSKWKA